MIKKVLLTTVVASTLALGSARAGVSTIETFDDPAANALVDQQFSSFSDNGLTFTANGGFAYIFDGTFPNSNGTNALAFYGFPSGTYLAITATGGGTFTLNSIDFAISLFDSNSSETVTVNNIPLTITDTLTTYDLNLVGVSEVDISGVSSISGYWLADNVNVPEPASMALLGAGVFGLGLIRRRRA